MQKDEVQGCEGIEDVVMPLASFDPMEGTMMIFEQDKNLNSSKIDSKMIVEKVLPLLCSSDVRKSEKAIDMISRKDEGVKLVQDNKVVDKGVKDLIENDNELDGGSMELLFLDTCVDNASTVNGIPENCIIVHNADGPYVMSKCKWPNLQEPSHRVNLGDLALGIDNSNEGFLKETQIQIGASEIQMDGRISIELENGANNVDHGWSVPPAVRKTKKAKGNKIIEPTRKSSRTLKMVSQFWRKLQPRQNRRILRQVLPFILTLLLF